MPFPPTLGECDFAPVHKEPEKFSDVIAYYNVIRDYVKHEDGLINSRLTWSLTVHGFLLTSFGLMFSKSSDLFAEFTRTSTVINPVVHGLEIAFLCVAQLLVAYLGLNVARSSLGSIRAAHMAIQYVNSVAHSSVALDVRPPKRVLTNDVKAGLDDAIPDAMSDILKGTYVAIGSIASSHEIVSVSEVAASSFKAVFKRDHPAGSEVLPLGCGLLLPRVIGGGDRGQHTNPAHEYYFSLPKLAGLLWTFLIWMSILLGVSALGFGIREQVRSQAKTPIQQPLAPPPPW